MKLVTALVIIFVFLSGTLLYVLSEGSTIPIPDTATSKLPAQLLDTNGDGTPDIVLLDPSTGEDSIFKIISFISALLSVILALMAILLSIVFYRMSSALSVSTGDAAKGIGASVVRLEKLFDSLYSDTFSMMKDTVTDMRKHAWPDVAPEKRDIAEETEEKIEEKVNELRQQLVGKVDGVLNRHQIMANKVESLSEELSKLIDDMLVSVRKAEHEATEETIKSHILQYLRSTDKLPVFAGDIVQQLTPKFSFEDIVYELYKMAKENTIAMSTLEIKATTEIKLVSQKT